MCQHLVLANGASDLANRLGVRGEGLSIPWLKYELPHLEYALQSMRPIERLKLKPVMIVGAGLSAADAVSMCRSSGIRVIHVFRSRTVGLDKQLPENVYPEYHEVSACFIFETNYFLIHTFTGSQNDERSIEEIRSLYTVIRTHNC